MYEDALTTNTRIKDRLQITVTTWDALLDRLILAVTGRIEQMTNRRFTLAEYENEIHDGSDTYGTRRTMLVTKHAPVQAIASIEYKGGLNSDPVWTAYSENDYDADAEAGIVYFPFGLPLGKRNIRITYTAGFSGYALGNASLWHFNVTPSGLVNGSNLTFTLPENADQVIVYADGPREASVNVTFTPGTATFTLAAGRAPTSTIAIDYLATALSDAGDVTLPADIVEVCEQAVVRIFKRRESEGKSSEGFQESTITWAKNVFTDEDLATIRNYRRGYYL
jgi:hypothetical protein